MQSRAPAAGVAAVGVNVEHEPGLSGPHEDLAEGTCITLANESDLLPARDGRDHVRVLVRAPTQHGGRVLACASNSHAGIHYETPPTPGPQLAASQSKAHLRIDPVSKHTECFNF